MSSLVYTVYCQKQPSEQRCCVKKGVFKDFVNFVGKHLCWSLFLNKVSGLTPILKNICQRLLLYCSRITHCYLTVLLYIQHLLPPMFVFGLNSKGFKEFKSGISFSLKSHFHGCFLFPCFFCLCQFCFIFSCRCS